MVHIAPKSLKKCSTSERYIKAKTIPFGYKSDGTLDCAYEYTVVIPKTSEKNGVSQMFIKLHDAIEWRDMKLKEYNIDCFEPAQDEQARQKKLREAEWTL